MKVIKIEGIYYCENDLGQNIRLKEWIEKKIDKKTGLPYTNVHLVPEKREDSERMGGRYYVMKSKVDKDIQANGYHYLAPHTEKSSSGRSWREVLPDDLKEELESLEIRLEEIKEIGREIASRPLTEEEKAQRELKKTIENLKKLGVNVDDLLKTMRV